MWLVWDMGRPVRVLIGPAVLAATGVIVWLVFYPPAPDEPMYQGHTLSYWLNALPLQDAKGTSPAAVAISQIGTNAIPSLLRAVNGRNPTAPASVIYALGRIHADPEAVVPVLTREIFDSNIYTRTFAVEGLANFGTNARDAAPLLAEMLNDSRWYQGSGGGGDLRGEIRFALQQIDPGTYAGLATNSDTFTNQ
jgi:HEAT repeats